MRIIYDLHPPKRRLPYLLIFWSLGFSLVLLFTWSMVHTIEQTTRSPGAVITRSRVQVIQAVYGGQLQSLNVQQGDIVQKGQVIALLHHPQIMPAAHKLNGGLAQAEAQLITHLITTERRPSLYQHLTSNVIRSPVNGIVKRIQPPRSGGVLAPGDELMRIVPFEDRLLIETKVRTADMTTIHSGLPASVQFYADDHTSLGALEGTVTYVSADTIREDSRSGAQNFYRVHVEAECGLITRNTGKPVEIFPGMIAQVNIRTGQKTVLDTILNLSWISEHVLNP